jgi:hypothetical protein
MIQYLRIPKNKFWGWVFSSIVIGLLLGAGAAWTISRSSSAKQVDDLKQQLASEKSSAASNLASLQSRLDSANTSLTTVAQQVDQLKTAADAAKAATTKKSSTSSTASSTVTLEVTSRSVSPSSIATGDAITLTAQVQGNADRVTMRIYSSGGSSYTYSLKKSSTDGDASTWKRTVNGPKKAGTYHYYATAYAGTKSATMPGASPKTLTVK